MSIAHYSLPLMMAAMMALQVRQMAMNYGKVMELAEAQF